MIRTRHTWREKRLAKEEGNCSKDSDQGLADDGVDIGVNMVFELPAEFQVLNAEVAELVLGARAAVFQKPGKMGLHMKPLLIRGYL
jgi:hypothetical protein